MILDNSDIVQHSETLWYLTMHAKQKQKVCMLILPDYVYHKKQQLPHWMSQWLTCKEIAFINFSCCWKVKMP
jgi:hypothetical protein